MINADEKRITVHRNSFVRSGNFDTFADRSSRALSCPNITYRNSVHKITLTNTAQVRITFQNLYLGTLTVLIFFQGCYANTIAIFKSIIDFSQFSQLHFLLFSLSTMLLFIWFIVPYFYLVEHLTQNGYTESQATVVLAIVGFSNTIGMVS